MARKKIEVPAIAEETAPEPIPIPVPDKRTEERLVALEKQIAELQAVVNRLRVYAPF